MSEYASRNVVVFGCFDGVDDIHEGHKYFLREAAKGAKHLTVVLTDDVAFPALKKRASNRCLTTRAAWVSNYLSTLDGLFYTIMPGDRDSTGEYNVLNGVEFDELAVGYDQGELHKSFAVKFPTTKVRQIGSHNPDVYSTTAILRREGKS